jgi:hypothetical protein
MLVLLTCSNLKNWVSDLTLASIFQDASFIHRETEFVAYIGYQEMELAFKSVGAHHCQTLIKRQTPQDQTIEKVKLNVHPSVDYIGKIWETLLVPSDTSKSKRSLYLSVVSSYVGMSVNQWLQLFPTAYEVHKQTNRSRAFIEFSDIFLAEAAQKEKNKKTFTVMTPNGAVNVYISCFFTSKKSVMNKRKQCSRNLLIATEHEEKLSKSIVNWLF